MSDPDKLELRGLIDRELLEAIDMVALSKGGMSRIDLVTRVMRGYVAAKQREAMLVMKAPRINPPVADSSWSELDGSGA